MKKMSLQLLFLSIIFFYCNPILISQELQVIQSNEKITIKSKILNEERTALIRVPANYTQNTAKYPVIYMLDGHPPRINLMTGTIENLVSADHVPDMIVVSIPNTDRRRDMTPSSVANQPGSGGADNFIRFIETELIPEVEKNYRTQPYRIIVGHSLSGLFVMYTFSSKPELFNAYLAASPHMQWDDHYLLKNAEQLLKPKKDLKRTVFVALGDEPQYLQGFNGFNDILKRLNIKNLDYDFQQLKVENHTSINAPVFHHGLREVWSDLTMTQPEPATEQSLKQVEDHYKKASEKYGYQIPIPENFLNTLGYRLMQDNKDGAAIKVFEKNIKLYPASANTYDSFAEALEKIGELAKAKENLEIGVKLAEKGNNEGLTNAIRENLKRVSAKLAN
jgi:uncharacterized protein